MTALQARAAGEMDEPEEGEEGRKSIKTSVVLFLQVDQNALQKNSFCGLQ